ncbi:MAG: hypothetical protein MZV64_42385 [Ignavibacteriales bacterium]|nr:hypothetical protein [Ignavibacteriales bacterium]
MAHDEPRRQLAGGRRAPCRSRRPRARAVRSTASQSGCRPARRRAARRDGRRSMVDWPHRKQTIARCRDLGTAVLTIHVLWLRMLRLYTCGA